MDGLLFTRSEWLFKPIDNYLSHFQSSRETPDWVSDRFAPKNIIGFIYQWDPVAQGLCMCLVFAFVLSHFRLKLEIKTSY